eukprot:3696147-Rhodomonas_salina.1
MDGGAHLSTKMSGRRCHTTTPCAPLSNLTALPWRMLDGTASKPSFSVTRSPSHARTFIGSSSGRDAHGSTLSAEVSSTVAAILKVRRARAKSVNRRGLSASFCGEEYCGWRRRGTAARVCERIGDVTVKERTVCERDATRKSTAAVHVPRRTTL